MTKRAICVAMAIAFMLVGVGPRFSNVRAGQVPDGTRYRVLAPISHGNLTIFPVVAATTHDTSMFITLDEGLRAGTVMITEAGQVEGLRRRPGRPIPAPRPDGAQVNRLELVNNSDRALILLAGEIVSGGKQDRVVGKDRIVPPNSDPVDLSVFCVEPGRWTAVSETFGGLGKGRAGAVANAPAPIAQPSVRSKAMADKDQRKVWDSVSESSRKMAAGAPVNTTSYAQVVGAQEVQARIDSVAAPVEQSFSGVMRQLRDQKAVGVVVAINGEIIWADIFASTPLLEKYWPKLARSYAAESLTMAPTKRQPSQSAAQQFLEQMAGTRETVESEPAVYRHTEIYGPGYRAFELASLLPKTGFDVHISKMSEYFGTESR